VKYPACVAHNVDWPFPDTAYADVSEFIDRFNTDERHDLVSVHDLLINREPCDPFQESEEAVHAFEAGNWTQLLRHNLADVRRTRELAAVASAYVPQSDFNMKNLQPPEA